MKLNLIISLLLLSLRSWSQIETKIFVPNFDSVSDKLNDTTLIDRVKYDKNVIYYEFKNNDTINEFFFVNDSTFKYRQTIDNSVFENGQFRFITTKIDTLVTYPPGQYEEELVYYYNGTLVKTGWWNENQFKLSGRYRLGKRVGLWSQRETDRIVKIEYNNGEIKSIQNPTEIQIEKHSNWLRNSELKICAQNTSDNFLNNWIEIVQSNCKCYAKNSSKLFDFKSDNGQARNEKTVYWKLNNDWTITIIYNDKTLKYSIAKLGRERIKLARIK